MQETNFSSLSTIQKQIIQIQKEVQDLNKKNELELLRDEFGGELLSALLYNRWRSGLVW